jgi:hypothetical protein
MKLIKWFLQFFQPPRAALPRSLARVKFLEGTEMQCPRCRTTLAIARRDIYHGSLKRSSDWDVRDAGFWDHRHCGAHVMRYGAGACVLIMTPTGWVG